MGLYWDQFIALLQRNVQLKIRSKKQTIQELLLPIYFVGILAIIKLTNPPASYEKIPYFPSEKLNSPFFIPLDVNLGVVPNNDSIVRDIIDIFESKFMASAISSNLSVEYFASEHDMVETYLHNSSVRVNVGVIFDLLENVERADNTSYTLKLDINSLPGDIEAVFGSQTSCRNTYIPWYLDTGCPANKYLLSGITTIQTIMDNSIIQVRSNSTSTISLPDWMVRMFPKRQYSPPFTQLQILSSIYFVIAFSPFVTILLTTLVTEKERKIKEGMKMMGLSDIIFWLSWAAIYSVFITFESAVTVGIAYAVQIFQYSNFILIFLAFFLYGMAIIALAFAFTPFFNKAQVAGGFGSLATMLFTLFYLIVLFFPDVAIPLKYLMCLMAPCALAITINTAIELEFAFVGAQFSDLSLSASEFTYGSCLLMLVVDAVIYLALAWYFENVIPGDYGQRRPPWFCLQPSFWFGKGESLVQYHWLMSHDVCQVYFPGILMVFTVLID